MATNPFQIQAPTLGDPASWQWDYSKKKIDENNDFMKNMQWLTMASGLAKGMDWKTLLGMAVGFGVLGPMMNLFDPDKKKKDTGETEVDPNLTDITKEMPTVGFDSKNYRPTSIGEAHTPIDPPKPSMLLGNQAEFFPNPQSPYSIDSSDYPMTFGYKKKDPLEELLSRSSFF